MNITELPELSFNRSINRSSSQQTFFTLNIYIYPDARCSLKKWEIRIRFKDAIPRTRYNILCLAVPFSAEKSVEWFRRALLGVIEGWKLLAPIASTRSMSGFWADVGTAACATRVSNLNVSGCTENTVHVSSTLRLFCITDRYQVSGIRCSILLILAASR